MGNDTMIMKIFINVVELKYDTGKIETFKHDKGKIETMWKKFKKIDNDILVFFIFLIVTKQSWWSTRFMR